MEKRELILNELIAAYIDNPVPVSSSSLQERLRLKISSATIRYYFKQLTQKGYLHKPYVSSGRIPSEKSLKLYWLKHLQPQKRFYLKSEAQIEEQCKRSDIFCEYSLYANRKLDNVEKLNGHFLVCTFGEEEFVLPYNRSIEKFLLSMKGKSVFEISNICKDLGLYHLSMKLKEFSRERFAVFNVFDLVKIAAEDKEWADEQLGAVMSGKLLHEKRSGIDFYHKILTYKFYIDIDHKTKGEVLLMGKLHQDYLEFIKNLKGASHG